MGIFDRITTVIKSNINDLINRAEDPEKMLNQMMIDLREQLAQAKREVAVAIADEKRLQKLYEAEADQAAQWEKRAMLAVEKGDDALAREALTRKKEHENLANQYKKQWEQQKASTENLKNALRTLNRKIEEASRKKNLLVARQKRAKAQKHIHETMSRLADTSAFETFDRMAAKVDQMEAEAEAAVEIEADLGGEDLEKRFAELETGSVDAELAALKAKMGKTGS
ncbi:MAG: PspA/IM30 family protein [Nitrospinota bacterium]|nr:MAG: PspA/IM30 family protein [Nitrospinota bacterium]